MRICSFPGCKTGRISERRHTKLNNIRKKSLFTFPKDPKIREQWELVIGRKAPSRGLVCENHFICEDIMMHNCTINLTNGKTEYIERGKICLRPTAVPFIPTVTPKLKPCLVCNTLYLEMISIPWHPIKLEYMLKTLLDLQPKKDDYICRICCDAVIKMSNLRSSEKLASETAAELAIKTETKSDNKGELEIFTPINKIKDERDDSHMFLSDNSLDLDVKVETDEITENHQPKGLKSTNDERDPASFTGISKREHDIENDSNIVNLGSNSRQNDNMEDYQKFCIRKPFIEYANYSDRTEGSIYTITMIDESSEQNEKPKNVDGFNTVTMGDDSRQNDNDGTDDYWEYWNGSKSVDNEYDYNDGIEGALSSIKIIGNRLEFNEQPKNVEASNNITMGVDFRQNDNDGVEDYWEYWKSEKLDEIENNYSDRTENSIYTIIMNRDRLEPREESKNVEEDSNIVTMDSGSKQSDSDGSEDCYEYWKRKRSVDAESNYSDVTESTICSIKVIGESAELNEQSKNVEDDSNIVDLDSDSNQNDSDGSENWYEYWKREKSVDDESNYNDVTRSTICSIKVIGESSELNEQPKNVEDDSNIVTLNSDSRQNDSDDSENCYEYRSSELNKQLKNNDDIESQIASYVVHKNRKNSNLTNITNMKEDAFYCKCGLGFRLPDTLKFHMEKYAGIKHYSCSYCRQTLRRKYTLRKHIDRHIKENPHLPPYA